MLSLSATLLTIWAAPPALKMSSFLFLTRPFHIVGLVKFSRVPTGLVKFRFYRRIVCRIYMHFSPFPFQEFKPILWFKKRFSFRKKYGSKKLTNLHFFTAMANGYVTFVISLVFIGACTAVIGDVAAHLGCFINLKDGVNAIAFVALGTSGPGTKFVGFQNGFFGFCYNLISLSLLYTLSFILYILRISYTLFLPYTLSFISYI